MGGQMAISCHVTKQAKMFSNLNFIRNANSSSFPNMFVHFRKVIGRGNYLTWNSKQVQTFTKIVNKSATSKKYFSTSIIL
jgi:hypothetical protein